MNREASGQTRPEPPAFARGREGPESDVLPKLAQVRPPAIGIVAGWLSGLVLLGGLVTFVLHHGDVTVFLSKLKSADPLWLFAAVVSQAATYACAASVWLRVLSRAKTPLPFGSLFRLAILQLFANQALPTGGLSGAAMVASGLVKRDVPVSLVTTAILVSGFTYYASYLAVALSAFVILWHSGDLGAAWIPLATAFFMVLLALAGVTLLLVRRQGRIIPEAARGWAPAKKLAKILGSARADVLRDWRLIFEAFLLQVGIFVLDAATLWIAARSIGLDIDLVSAFSSFVLASAVATISLIPLGLGTFEGTCTALLHIMGNSIEGSLAATLILRGLTLWLPMVPGLWLIRRELNGKDLTAAEGTGPAGPAK
ncbi:lysylphosphatidylglycerol synthase transmembrane domain-containing protein [Ciceribacter azotifigens]|uniref:lysylphosphatidylglycerol synthase transmembrane domain-containing protein n=1 Tax=Ciceribacter azotifigens TaxID=2069303 RepID=UPI003A8C7A09